MTARNRRLRIIKAIERKRSSKVICYVTSDRAGLPSQIAEESFRLSSTICEISSPKTSSNLDLFYTAEVATLTRLGKLFL
jgi:hypothetical protein